VSNTSGPTGRSEALFGQLAVPLADLVITELSLPDGLVQSCTDEIKGTEGMTQDDVNVITFSVLFSITSDLVRTSLDDVEGGNLVTVLGPTRTSSEDGNLVTILGLP